MAILEIADDPQKQQCVSDALEWLSTCHLTFIVDSHSCPDSIKEAIAEYIANQRGLTLYANKVGNSFIPKRY